MANYLYKYTKCLSKYLGLLHQPKSINRLYPDYQDHILNFLKTVPNNELPIPNGEIITHSYSGIGFRPQEKYNLQFIENILKPTYFKDTRNFIILKSFDMTLIPKGRTGDTIHRDNLFLRNMNTILDRLPNLNNTMFLNYTGHLSSFATSLLSHGIDCIWQLPEDSLFNLKLIKSGYSINNRVLDQLQDTVNSKLQFRITNSSSFGIVLEAQHSIQKTISLSELPSELILMKNNIQNIIVFTEIDFGHQETNLRNVEDIQIGDLKIYLDSLKSLFNITIYGTEPGLFLR